MSLLALVVVIALIGLIVGLAQQAPWIDGFFKTLIWWVGVIAAVIVLLEAFGVLEMVRAIQVPHFGR